MLRFAIKTGVAATAVYYVSKEGVWEKSEESLKVYNKLNSRIEPYAKEVRKYIPLELPEIPESERTSHTIRLYWNKGVLTTFEFLVNFPHLISTWTSKTIMAILENPDVQKLLETSTTDNNSNKVASNSK